MSGEKTEKATPRRREQAVKDGNLWQPRELPTASALGVGALVAAVAGPWLWQGLADYLAAALGRAAPAPRLLDDIAGWPIAVPLLLAAGIALAAAAVALATTGHAGLERLVPKAKRLSPVAGFKRIFSLQGLGNAGFAIAKLLALLALGLWLLWPQLPALAMLDVGGLPRLGAALVRLVGVAALLVAGIAAAEAAFSWWRREQQLMMSRDEVKRESRESDGAPELKAAIKRAQFAAATRRMKKSLADAAVVVVNPTHFAVALRYQPGSDAAPVVVEKGRMEMAQAVIAAARELGVPVIRTPRLARALFWTARRGAMVREELFQAVATILAFVMHHADAESRAVPDGFVPPAFDFDETGARRKPGAPLPL